MDAKNNKSTYPCVAGKLKSADCPTMDDPIGDDLLKSGGRMKQKKRNGRVHPTDGEAIFRSSNNVEMLTIKQLQIVGC